MPLFSQTFHSCPLPHSVKAGYILRWLKRRTMQPDRSSSSPNGTTAITPYSRDTFQDPCGHLKRQTIWNRIDIPEAFSSHFGEALGGFSGTPELSAPLLLVPGTVPETSKDYLNGSNEMPQNIESGSHTSE